jgi:hypothetical protein
MTESTVHDLEEWSGPSLGDAQDSTILLPFYQRSTPPLRENAIFSSSVDVRTVR